MCEVGSCCGCISLFHGGLIAGIITIFAGVSQVAILSFVLYKSYEAPSSLLNSSSILRESTEGSTFYSFSSKRCPFGFVLFPSPHKNNPVVIKNEPIKQGIQYQPIPPTRIYEADQEDMNSTGILTGLNIETPSTQSNSFKTTLKNHIKRDLRPQTRSSVSSLKITCLAPTQAVLCALLVASAFLIPIGFLLIIGVIKRITTFLSLWFFYTVGYNLSGLLVALTDGAYTGATDVSTYIICLITAYCIIVVDSYYETLLREERVEASSSRLMPTLVVEKPNSDSEGESPTTSLVQPRPKIIGSDTPGYAFPAVVADFC